MRYINPEALDSRLQHYVTQGQLTEALAHLERQILAVEKKNTTIGEALVATQADVDAITANVQTAVTNIQAEITALQQANPSLDLSGLQGAVATLDAIAPTPGN